MPLAHIGGLPIEETLPTAVPLAAAAGWWFRTEIREAVVRLRRHTTRRSGRRANRESNG